jgi:hypothetical protein
MVPSSGHLKRTRVQEAALAQPAAPLDNLAVHHCDLPGGSAEAVERDV